ncbi:5'-nucleotidase C-terminal domain-containing protein [Jatrophihabitans telluris]|uniref:5'-nucleotidase C-terminal domain-containing protein n=1 Tax=Jatrophihabitans telluris TaxID=2038343 RepID=A0ABY4QZM5_9ACTN|nr:5'-nucleotidase C-terminal domain-containing protein [Jatrophihabitans telluris]UQX88299.1 5'-nucleotidase C-terminal domain-containing protein [Jatrophihabitans telluris]
MSRRQILASAAVTGAGAALWAAGAATASASAPAEHPDRFTLTVLGTTDTHGNVFNWDYFKDAEYDDAAHNDIGLAKIATLIAAVRDERGRCTTLTLDAGDTIQGTPLSYYYAKIDPITAGPVHPMAAAMNAIGYDAAALGNHEFNYGVALLRKFQAQLHHPLLGANALDWNTGEPAFPEYVIKKVPVGPKASHHGHGHGHDHGREAEHVSVGIVGLVTPGCAIWDKANLDGRITFNGIVEQAAELIPRVKRAGADIVIVSCHSGASTSSSYGDALPWPENASTLLAANVPDIDAILVGHAHVEIEQRYVQNTQTGRQVLLSEPLKWGERLTVMDLDLQRDRHGRWSVSTATATLLNANTAAEDAHIVKILTAAHEKTRTYVNGVIGKSAAAMSAATSRYQDTAAIDFINYIQADAVTKATGTSLPVLSIAAPFNAEAAIPAGDVTVRDVAGLYIYDNTLEAIQFTGAQVRAYLEFSATYFKQVSGSGPFAAADVTNAVTPTAPGGTPDYNYDIMGGLGTSAGTRLTYDIDIAKAPGSRIVNLAYGGAAVADEQQFLIAINNYRASGGGNFPGVTTAPVVYNAQVEIRQLIIDWVSAVGTIDPSVFASVDWRLLANGQPITITG